MNKNITWLNVILSVFLVSGCATAPKKISTPLPAKVDYVFPPYVSALKGQKICLDPGHGGDAEVGGGYKRGPTGVREAEVNLRVGLALQAFLEKAGATVYMTRTTDVFVGLAERCYFANTCGAEFFVSMHHNASSNASTNFTSTWYHADPDYGHLNIDIARYVQDGVSNSLGLEQRPPVQLKSDYYVYPNAGFAVLRNTKIPGTLCEASFHSNPEEEKRIANPEYNKREAYGYFLGLAKFFFSGIPREEVIAPESVITNRQPEIKIKINDGMKGQLVLADSVQVLVDGKSIPATYNRSSGLITATPPSPLANNFHTVVADFMNLNKTSAYPNPYKFQIAPPVHSLDVKITPTIIPNDGESEAAVFVNVKDDSGNPVADGTVADLTATSGKLSQSQITTLNGIAIAYIISPLNPGEISVTAKHENIYGTSLVNIAKIKTGYLVGEIVDQRNGKPVENAEITVSSLADNPVTKSFRDGKFLMEDIYSGEQLITVVADGFQTLKLNAKFVPNKTTFVKFDLIRK